MGTRRSFGATQGSDCPGLDVMSPPPPFVPLGPDEKDPIQHKGSLSRPRSTLDYEEPWAFLPTYLAQGESIELGTQELVIAHARSTVSLRVQPLLKE